MADKALNRTELVAAVAADSGQSTAAVNAVIDALFSNIAASVGAGAKVTIPGWLAVEPTHRAVQTGRNPSTGEAISIAANKGVRVSAGTNFKLAHPTRTIQRPVTAVEVSENTSTARAVRIQLLRELGRDSEADALD